MDTIIARAHAKINWSLDVLGAAEGGYHALDMLMQPIALCDEMTFSRSGDLSLEIDGVPCTDGGYLIFRAARALLSATGHAGGAAVTVKKGIPDRAGLGGASANCAAALVALNRLWELGLSHSALMSMGARLGADVPFCLTGGLCRVGGIGDVVRPLCGGVRADILVVMPDQRLSTADVFREYDRVGGDAPPSTDAAEDALLRGDWRALGQTAGNALLRAASSLAPGIAQAMEALNRSGALYVQMSGSGSAAYGVFPDEDACLAAHRALGAHFPRRWATKTGFLSVEI